MTARLKQRKKENYIRNDSKVKRNRRQTRDIKRWLNLNKKIQHKIYLKKLRTIKKQEMKSQMTQAEQAADIEGLKYYESGARAGFEES